jgi:hypothetical protein
MLRSGVGLVASASVAFLALGAVNRPVRTPDITPATLPVTPVVRQQTAQTTLQEWTFQTDGPTLSRDLNTWAAGQAPLQTPVGMARLEQLSAEIRDNELVVHGTANAGWLNAPVDAAATAQVQSGRVLVQVRQAHINGVDVPEVARHELEQQLQNQLEQSIGANQIVVRSVQMGGGKLVVSGTRP